MNEQQIIEAALKDGGMPAAQAAAYRLLLQHADRFSAMENLEKEEASGGRSAATPSPDTTIEEHCRKMLAIALADDIAENPEFLSSGDIVGMANYLNKLFKLSGAKSNKGEAPCTTGNVNFSGPAPESGLDPRVGEISRGHDGKWRACGRDDMGTWRCFAESTNLADLVGTSYPVLTQRMAALTADNSKLRAKVEALAALNVRLTDERNEFETRLSAIEDRDSKAICRVFDMDGKAETKHAAQVASLTKERDEALQMVEALRKDNRSVILLRDESRRARDAAQDQIAHWNGLFDTMRKSEQQSYEKLEAAQQDRYTAERTRDAALAEADRLLRIKRRLREELDATRADYKAALIKLDSAAMVREFNRKFGVPIADKPAFPARDRMDLRVRLIAEEFGEFLTACGYTYTVNVSRGGRIFVCDYSSYTLRNPDLVAAADGLADMQFVIWGTSLEFGIPLAAVFAEVHRSNMTKTGLPDAGGKITKGDGYEPPKIEDILSEHGWEGR